MAEHICSGNLDSKCQSLQSDLTGQTLTEETFLKVMEVWLWSDLVL